ncbi:putative mfs monosaccharide transporter protein [Phaeoacremonium minimum UCRPA7]|uniref:Putative mfs monosaccharide transporter protein n=1 Tax=Phaeoacremonium minimum (strain UCR-PA7) TaxID=1286976 RepID=R8BHZ5_PHAM7|nr:putative mfs monosaccharide transporter protein [Phaeoacremonium minimum UCRPA7]EON98862.1 putative mfs monosaccharide transporter protein [Phaeoacremonium minimum UCRPA7]
MASNAGSRSEHHEDVDASDANTSNKQGVTRTMLFFTIWIAFASWISNFDNGYAGTVITMPAFKSAFGSCETTIDAATGAPTTTCTLSAMKQSLINLASLFMGVGGVLSGPTGYYLGRRGTVAFASALSVVGAAGMLGTSGSYINYMVCRCISSVGLGQMLAATSIYGAECVAANRRGVLLGLFNVGLAMGNVAATAVCAGSATLDPSNNWQWQTPVICQIPLGILLGTGIWMFPESPRWLMTKGNEEAARKSFGRFYGKPAYSQQITTQINDVLRHLESERALGSTTSWTEIFHRADIRRTSVSALILVGLAISGIQFVAPYTALFLQGVGVSNFYVINVIIGVSILAGASIGSWTVEYGGRRFSLILGYSILSVCMLIVGAVGTALDQSNPIAQKVLVAFLCIWAFVFGGFIGPCVWLASAEMHSVRLRTYGQANTTLFYEIFAFGSSFWTPYMLSADYGNMGTNVGYFHFGVSAVLAVLMFLFVPETARLTLEQIDEYFTSGRKAWHTSTRRNKLIASGTESDTGVLGTELEQAKA